MVTLVKWICFSRMEKWNRPSFFPGLIIYSPFQEILILQLVPNQESLLLFLTPVYEWEVQLLIFTFHASSYVVVTWTENTYMVTALKKSYLYLL